MTDLLVFIRSLRERKYPLYIASLALSSNYDLLPLPQSSPQLHKSFMDVYFTFQKTDCRCSLMGLDQIHEQNNAVMKGMGGATSSLNKADESS